MLGGRKRSNPLGQAARRRAASQKARRRVETAGQNVENERLGLEDLEQELAEKIAAITDEYAANAEQIEEIEIPVEKTDIRVAQLRLV